MDAQAESHDLRPSRARARRRLHCGNVECEMSNLFGFSTQPSSGEFTPILKYDSRAGRLFRRDRIDVGGTWTNDEVDITSTFRAVVDLENVEVGWISFSSGVPDFKLVPNGQPIPPRPDGVTDKGRPAYQNGIRIMLKL